MTDSRYLEGRPNRHLSSTYVLRHAVRTWIRWATQHWTDTRRLAVIALVTLSVGQAAWVAGRASATHRPQPAAIQRPAEMLQAVDVPRVALRN